jgi:hypothetical protein
MKRIGLFFLLLVVSTLFGYVMLNGLNNFGHWNWSWRDIIQSLITSLFIAFWISFVLVKKKK